LTNGNAQGGFCFYSLTTGHVITRNRWTELPMPNEVIDHVGQLAQRANAASGGLAFQNQFGIPIPDNVAGEENGHDDFLEDSTDDDGSYVVADDNSDHSNDDELNTDIGDNNSNEFDDGNLDVDVDENQDIVFDDDNFPAPPLDIDEGRHLLDVDPDLHLAGDNANFLTAYNQGGQVVNETEFVANPEVEDVRTEADALVNSDQIDDLETPGVGIAGNGTNHQQNTYNLRPQRERTYDHLYDPANHYTMTQYLVKKGLRLFGTAGTDAVAKELKQLHDLKVIEPVDDNSLSTEDKSAALQYLMFLKQNRYGCIKGHGCADGRKQRIYMSKEDTSSPTVAIESVFLSCVIDADESRDVATVGIPGAFLQADMNDVVHLRIDGEMASILANLAPSTYSPFLTFICGTPTLYVITV
jgi:hypothetical protein